MRTFVARTARFRRARGAVEHDGSRAIVRYIAVLAFLAVAGYVLAVAHERHVAGPLTIPWFVFVVAFAVSDNFAIHFEFGDNAHSFNLNELPLVIGLFCCDPRMLVVARVLAALAVLAVVQRQRLVKLAFNIAWAALESVVVVGAFVFARHGGGGPATLWFVAIALPAFTTTLQAPAILAAVRWAGGHPEPRQAVMTALLGMVTSAATASLGVAAVNMLEVDATAGIVVMAVIAGVLFFAYRGYAVVSQRYANLERLYGFTQLLAHSPEFETAMRVTLHEACEALRAERGELCLLDGDADDASFVRVEYGDNRLDVSVGEDLAQDWTRQCVIADQRGIVISRHTRDAAERQYLADHALSDLAIVPLRKADEIIGTLAVKNRRGEVSTFGNDDLKVFETLANHASVTIENGRLIDQLRNEVAEKHHQAMHDALTNLGNRNLLTLRADEALVARRSGGWRCAMLLMDLNGFREVNDTLGHQRGDALLAQVAARLRKHAPSNATIARLGGDEFAILLPQVQDAQEALTAAFALQGAMHAPFIVDDVQLAVTGAIGVAIAPDHGDTTAALLQHGDIAMYQAKDTQDPGVALYDAEYDHHSERRLALVADLRDAIDDESLTVYYQPKADLRTGAITGVEALLRWEHPTYGPIPPMEFVSMAEGSGLIRQMTMFVLRRALHQLREWHAAGFDDLSVAVNLSARSLMSLELAGDVARELRAAEVPARALTLEITETQMMADRVRTIAVLERLSDLGVHISVDDFGTGYSSLSYLQSLPVDELKIDKSFVLKMTADEANEKIVQSIVDLARNLELRVVAEGIEDAVTWETLARLRCDIGQGYFLSRPIPPERLTPWLIARREQKPNFDGETRTLRVVG